MVWRSGLVLAAIASSAFAVPASAALYAEVGIAPPQASIGVVPDRTYTERTYAYTQEPAYVEHRSYVVESPRYYYYSEPETHYYYYYSEPSRVYIAPY